MAIETAELRASRLLADLPDRQLRRLGATMRECRYDAGDVILNEGDGGIAFFVLLEGEAEVQVTGRPRVQLRPGDWFGEIALLDERQRRTASIVATTPTRCAALTAWEFRPFLAEHPDVSWQVLRSLAQRVSDEHAFAMTSAAAPA